MSDIIKKSKKLTEAAKEVFGDLIRTAYISTYDCGSKKDISERLKREEKNWSKAKDILSIEGGTIFIQFRNNKLIGFNASEWAGVFEAKKALKKVAEL